MSDKSITSMFKLVSASIELSRQIFKTANCRTPLPGPEADRE